MSVEWGSVADWAAAVGSVAAVVYAVRLGAGQTRAARRQQAEAVAVWADGGDRARFLHVHNGSALPISGLCTPGWGHDDHGEEVRVAWHEGALGPQESKKIDRFRGDPKFGRYRVVVEFVDAAGRRWRRGIDGVLEEIRSGSRRRWYAPWRR